MKRAVVIAAVAVSLLGTPAAAAPGDPGTIGVVGCSNTLQAVTAYTAASTLDLLAPTARWGTSMSQWASSRNQRFWETYDELRPADGYSAAWLNLCARVSKRDGTPLLTQSHIDAVLVKIWQRDPGIPVYINPLNSFTDEQCPTSGGNTVPALGAVLADDTAAAYADVYRVDDLGPIDGEPCHLTAADQLLIGDQLVSIFD